VEEDELWIQSDLISRHSHKQQQQQQQQLCERFDSWTKRVVRWQCRNGWRIFTLKKKACVW
jgi:hypothetical protein